VARREKDPAILSDQLRAKIRESGLSACELAQASKIDRSNLHRFLTCQRTITLTTADRLAAVLRLRLADDE
jgi:plasmid maintenance system antidote protein VapI